MSDADSIQADVAGVEPAGAQSPGTPESWRNVLVRHDREFNDVVKDPTRGPWNSTHNNVSYPGTYDAFEQTVGIAEQVAWVHTFSDGVKRDAGDVLLELMEFAIQWRKANELPASAFKGS